MVRQRRINLRPSRLFAGLLIALMGLGGSWGIAYGETAGPPAHVCNGAGNSGNIPQSCFLEPGEKGNGKGKGKTKTQRVAAEGTAANTSLFMIAGDAFEPAPEAEVQVPEAGVQPRPAQTESDRPDSGTPWSLALTGAALVAGGGLLLVRRRKTS